MVTKTNEKVSWLVPIAEHQYNKETDEFLIKGVAINETVTRNGVQYKAEELSKSAHTLSGRPLLKDHTNSVDAIVGKVVQGNWNEMGKNINFSAMVKDAKMRELIKEGMLASVSVGAMVKELNQEKNAEGEENQFYTARGIEFVELSLVAVPADPNAGFAKAMMEKFDLKEIIPVEKANVAESKSKTKDEAKKMAEETKTVEAVKAEPNKMEEAMIALTKQIESLNNKVVEMGKKEPPKTETKEEVKPTFKGQVAKEEVSVAMKGMMLEKSTDGKGALFSMDYCGVSRYQRPEGNKLFRGD